METQTRLRYHVQRSYGDTGSYHDVYALDDLGAAIAEAQREAKRNPKWHYVVWDDDEGDEVWVQ